jgi:hypothetical protein
MMLSITRKRASFSGTDFRLATFFDKVAEAGMDPVIHAYKKTLLARLNLTPGKELESLVYPEPEGELVAADLFFPADSVCCYLRISVVPGQITAGAKPTDDPFADPGEDDVKIDRSSLSIEVGELSPAGENGDSHLASLIAAIEPSLPSPVDWEDLAGPAPAEKLKGQTIQTPSEFDFELAGLLRDERLTPLLASLKAAETVVVDEFLEDLENREEMEYFVDKLLEIDFLSEEVVVYCTKTKQPTIRARDRSALEQLSAAGVKCMCGKPFDQEDVRRLTFVADEARYKMASSWVATIFLANTLLKVGLANKDILEIEAGESAKIYFTYFDGAPVMFLLGETIEPEAAQSAASEVLGARKDVQVVVFSENELPAEFSKYLDNDEAIGEVTRISNLDQMAGELAQLIESMRGNAAAEALDGMNLFTGIDITALAMKKLENAG